MRITVFTSNAIRHRFVANELAKRAGEALVISECRPSDAARSGRAEDLSPIERHFEDRRRKEAEFFRGNDYFISRAIPLLYKEVNLPSTFEAVKEFRPEAMFCFGSSIIRGPLLTLLPPGRFINLHLGLSPYYRGSGTNFWPFVNGELEYVGSTILHIDAGIDTGDIIAHIRPGIEKGDDVHAVGCRVIRESAAALIEVMGMVQEGRGLNRVKQWRPDGARYYRSGDFNEEILSIYKNNLSNGLVERYLDNPKKQLKLVPLKKRLHEPVKF